MPRKFTRKTSAKELRSFIQDESGNVEVGLVMIPLLILFLSVLQLPISALARTVYLGHLQSDTNLISYLGSYSPNSNLEKLNLADGGALIINNEKVAGPNITPLLPKGDNFSISAYSIDENSR